MKTDPKHKLCGTESSVCGAGCVRRRVLDAVGRGGGRLVLWPPGERDPRTQRRRKVHAESEQC